MTTSEEANEYLVSFANAVRANLICGLRLLGSRVGLIIEFGGLFHSSHVHRTCFALSPDAGKDGLNLLLEAADQLAVDGNQSLF